MLPRFIRRIIAPAVVSDADRLIADHEDGAAPLTRQILSAADRRHTGGHWRRVLTEIGRQGNWMA